MPLYVVQPLHYTWGDNDAIISCRLSTIGDRAFPVAASRLWDILPLNVATGAVTSCL